MISHLPPHGASRPGPASFPSPISFIRPSGLGCLVAVVLFLSGCDQLGLDTPAKAAERKQAEAKAIGSACRHALRAIEDCYVLNPKSDKSAVFAGWREMDEYMRENKLEGVTPVVPRPAPATAKPAKPEDGSEEDGGDGPDAGASDGTHKAGGH